MSFTTSFAKITDPNLIGSASVGSSIALPEQNKLVLAGGFPWGRWMLWGTLIAGAVLAALLLVRLVRQMRA